MKVSPSLIFFFSIHFSGEKPFTSPAMRQACLLASKRVMGAMPLLPERMASQVLSVSGPQGLTAPIPVMTTLRMAFIRSLGPIPRDDRLVALDALRDAGF